LTIQRLKPAPVAAAEGCVAVAKSGATVFQVHRACRVYDCCAAERSLRQLLQIGFQFSADEKKPAEAGFSQDHIDSLSAAILAMVDHP
jgi:hypothetical protein